MYKNKIPLSRLKRSFAVFPLLVFLLCAHTGCQESHLSAKSPGPSREEVYQEKVATTKTVEFYADYKLGREVAKEENKPVLLFFYTPFCDYSQKMMKETFSNEEVLKLSQEFICIKIDESRERKLCEELDVKGTPTIQFMTPRGTLLQRLIAQKSPNQLLVQMQVAIQSLASSGKVRARN